MKFVISLISVSDGKNRVGSVEFGRKNTGLNDLIIRYNISKYVRVNLSKVWKPFILNC